MDADTAKEGTVQTSILRERDYLVVVLIYLGLQIQGHPTRFPIEPLRLSSP